MNEEDDEDGGPNLVPLHNGYDSLAEGDLALIGSG
jgi:hypothetical protein